jgi:ribose-phosphate pyrophosphokinase
MDKQNIKIIAGSSYGSMAQDIAHNLNIPLTKCFLKKFKDGEIHFELLESLQGQDVYIVQSPIFNTNDHYIELFIMIEAAKRSHAAKIIPILPYFGYSRQDRPFNPYNSVPARLMADLLQTCGATQLITVDLHSGQIEGFFSIGIHHLSFISLIADTLNNNDEEFVIVSPDVGGLARARLLSEQVNNSQIAIIDKKRNGPGSCQANSLVGDVKNKKCILIDDIADSANTLISAAEVLQKNGAKSIQAFVTHAILTDNAICNLENSPIDCLTVSNSLPNCEKLSPKITVLSLTPLITKTIQSISA